MTESVKLHCAGCKDHGPFAPEPQCMGILQSVSHQPQREAVLEEALRTASLRFTKFAELHADKLLDGSLSEAQRQTIRGKVDRNLRYAAEARAALTTPAPAVSRDEIVADIEDCQLLDTLADMIELFDADFSDEMAEAETTGERPDLWPGSIEMPIAMARAILSRLRGEG